MDYTDRKLMSLDIRSLFDIYHNLQDALPGRELPDGEFAEEDLVVYIRQYFCLSFYLLDHLTDSQYFRSASNNTRSPPVFHGACAMKIVILSRSLRPTWKRIWTSPS